MYHVRFAGGRVSSELQLRSRLSPIENLEIDGMTRTLATYFSTFSSSVRIFSARSLEWRPPRGPRRRCRWRTWEPPHWPRTCTSPWRPGWGRWGRPTGGHWEQSAGGELVWDGSERLVSRQDWSPGRDGWWLDCPACQASNWSDDNYITADHQSNGEKNS